MKGGLRSLWKHRLLFLSNMKIDIFEKGGECLKMVTNLGVGTVIGNIASRHLGGTMLPVKVCAYIGSYILSMLLSEKTDDYINRKTEEYKHEYEDMKAMVEAIGQDPKLEGEG